MRTWIYGTLLGSVALGGGGASAQPGPRERPRDNALRVGDAAPDFKLARLRPEHAPPPAETPPDAAPGDKEPPIQDRPASRPQKDAPKGGAPQEAATVALSDFKGKKPVLLVFGSYT